MRRPGKPSFELLFFTAKPIIMKTLFPALVVISLSITKTCSAQPPVWASALANEVFPSEISSITFWEEKEMTWYNVDGLPDGSDSVRVNTLYIEGVTTSGHRFIAAIPVSKREINPVGARAVRGQKCTGACGCQCCKFTPNDYGCFCDTSQSQGCCVDQGGACNCWCTHELTMKN